MSRPKKRSEAHRRSTRAWWLLAAAVLATLVTVLLLTTVREERIRSQALQQGFDFEQYRNISVTPGHRGHWYDVWDNVYADVLRRHGQLCQPPSRNLLHRLLEPGASEAYKNASVSMCAAMQQPGNAPAIANICNERYECRPFHQIACAGRIIDAFAQDCGGVCRDKYSLLERVIPLLNFGDASVSISPFLFDFDPPEPDYHVVARITAKVQSGPEAGKTFSYVYDPGWFPDSFFSLDQTTKNWHDGNGGRTIAAAIDPNMPLLSAQCPKMERVWLKFKSYSGSTPEHENMAFGVEVVDQWGNNIPAPRAIQFGLAAESGSATYGKDFSFSNEGSSAQSFIIEPGIREKTITIRIIDDAIVEPDETFKLRGLGLSEQVTWYFFQPGPGTPTFHGTIVDNDKPPTPSPLPSQPRSQSSNRAGGASKVQYATPPTGTQNRTITSTTPRPAKPFCNPASPWYSFWARLC